MRAAQAAIDSDEFAEWMAYDRLEPFGPRRSDLNAGIIASVIANVNRDEKKRSKPFTPADFMPEFEAPEQQEEKPKQSWESQLKFVEMLNGMFGGKDQRHGNNHDPHRKNRG